MRNLWWGSSSAFKSPCHLIHTNGIGDNIWISSDCCDQGVFKNWILYKIKKWKRTRIAVNTAVSCCLKLFFCCWHFIPILSTNITRMRNCPDIVILFSHEVDQFMVSIIKSVMWFVMRSVMGSVSTCHEVYRTAHLSKIIKLPSLRESGQV